MEEATRPTPPRVARGTSGMMEGHTRSVIAATAPEPAPRESSVAPCQAFLGGTSGFFRAFKSEYSNVEAVKANGRSINEYKAAFTV